MRVEARITELRQSSTTTKPNDYFLNLEAVGTLASCEELMKWVEKFGDKKKMKDYKAWERGKQT